MKIQFHLGRMGGPAFELSLPSGTTLSEVRVVLSRLTSLDPFHHVLFVLVPPVRVAEEWTETELTEPDRQIRDGGVGDGGRLVLKLPVPDLLEGMAISSIRAALDHVQNTVKVNVHTPSSMISLLLTVNPTAPVSTVLDKLKAVRSGLEVFTLGGAGADEANLFLNARRLSLPESFIAQDVPDGATLTVNLLGGGDVGGRSVSGRGVGGRGVGGRGVGGFSVGGRGRGCYCCYRRSKNKWIEVVRYFCHFCHFFWRRCLEYKYLMAFLGFLAIVVAGYVCNGKKRMSMAFWF